MDKSFLISQLGSVGDVAKALGVSGPAVSQWPEKLHWAAKGRVAELAPEVWDAWKDQVKQSHIDEQAAA